MWLACAVAAIEILLSQRFKGAIRHLAPEGRSRCGPTLAIRIFREVGLFELLTLDGALTFRREDLYRFRGEIQKIFSLIPIVKTKGLRFRLHAGLIMHRCTQLNY